MYPERNNFDRIKFMIGNSYVVNMIKENRDVDDIINSWKERLERIKGIRKNIFILNNEDKMSDKLIVSKNSKTKNYIILSLNSM
jgi:hypothetical protein